MKRVEASVRIAAPPERVWDLIMDPDRLNDWVTIHRDIGKVSDNPLKQGSTLEQTLVLRHVPFHVKWTVVTSEPPRVAVWDGKGPAGSHAVSTYRLAPDGDGGTRFDYRNEFRPPLGPLGAAAGRVLAGNAPKREADGTLARLKSLLEEDG